MLTRKYWFSGGQKSKVEVFRKIKRLEKLIKGEYHDTFFT